MSVSAVAPQAVGRQLSSFTVFHGEEALRALSRPSVCPGRAARASEQQPRAPSAPRRGVSPAPSPQHPQRLSFSTRVTPAPTDPAEPRQPALRLQPPLSRDKRRAARPKPAPRDCSKGCMRHQAVVPHQGEPKHRTALMNPIKCPRACPEAQITCPSLRRVGTYISQ